MKIPPLLLAATLVFWGVESKNIIVGLSLACLIGGAVFIRRGWQLTEDDFIRISDITSVIFLATAALLLLHVEKIVFLKELVIWQPFVLTPLILAQLYSGKDTIIIGTRLGLRRAKTYAHPPLDFRVHYFFLCLLSAAMANSRSVFFYPGFCGLFFWLILTNRGKGYSLAVLTGLFLAATGMGYLTILGAESLHAVIRQKSRMYWREYFSAKYADPFQANISFGSVGRLKGSGEILLRLKTTGDSPSLLKLATYETLSKNMWHSKPLFSYLPIEDFSWNLIPPPHVSGHTATIEYYLPKEKGLLPQPYGSFRLQGDNLYELEQKADGTIRVTDGAPLVAYDISYTKSAYRMDDTPEKRNLSIPYELQDIFARVTRDWPVHTMRDTEKLKRVHHFFTEGFSYSLQLGDSESFSKALEDFLFENRSGHCELYATATTLLLRNLGIPSRYVTGFAVLENSWLEKKYVIRERHAHAWSEAYVDGHWVIVDTTPPDWTEVDTTIMSKIEWLKDIIAYLQLQYTYFQIETDQKYRLLLSAAVILLSTVLLSRIYKRMQVKREKQNLKTMRKTFPVPLSPFDQINALMGQLDIPRKMNEPFIFWVQRINQVHHLDQDALLDLYARHLQLRFDPRGMTDTELTTFVDKCGRMQDNLHNLLQNLHDQGKLS